MLNVFWLCDRKCPSCLRGGLMACTNDQCQHTSDKAHAINLKKSPDGKLPKSFSTFKRPDGHIAIFERKEQDNGS